VAVAVEVAAGEGLTLSQAARRLPHGRLDRPVAAATLWRWSRKGVTLPGGGKVFLETCRAGCRTFTSVPALQRFLSAQRRGEAPVVEVSKPTAKAKQGQQRIEATQDELGRLGI
jgi:hypothetical protein